MSEFNEALAEVTQKIELSRIKKPRLFYYEEAENCWMPAPDMLEMLLDLSMFGSDEEVIEIQFKRVDMTDEEFSSLPEA